MTAGQGRRKLSIVSDRTSTRVAWSACGVVLLVMLAGLVLHVLNHSAPSVDRNGWWASAAAAALGFAISGGLVASRQRRNPIGWLFLGLALTGATNLVAIEYGIYALGTRPGSLPGGSVALLLGGVVFTFTGMMLVVFLLFPDGRLPSRRWRPVLVVAIALPVLVMLGESVSPGRMPVPRPDSFPTVQNPLGIAALKQILGVLGGVAIVPVFATILAALSALVLRFRRSVGEERQQLKWIAYAGALMAIGFVGQAFVGTRYWQIVSPFAIGLFIAAVGVAVLRYRLYEIDLIINRTLVYGALTVSVVAGYLAAVALVGLLVPKLAASVLAAALVALVFAPLRLRLQHAVDRLLFGQRGDPYAVIAHLGERLEAAPAAEQVLPALVETVASTLKLPYTAIETLRGKRFVVAASCGRLVGEAVRLALAYQGEPVGRLVLGQRSPGEAFSRTELRLFEDLARQAAVAVHAVRLTADLQRSRERLVSAREEERRRLRRDLHDGLGPQLAGVGLQLDAARNLLDRDPAAADALLRQLGGEVQSAIADIRRLVYALRPPALDELGLATALRQQAARFAAGGNGARLTISVEASDRLDCLPAAVEVAAYRIVTEALTNVARHARAQRCTVRISRNGMLEVEVLDDGCGIAPGAGAGVGLTSIRERAAELGGTCTITAAPSGGTLVRARLPVGED
jgi:signal transduction histidine kinase